ncbi:hypothetical protein BBJ28_00018441 [Nothophytophthora sp. Chile5]|nr:hypothetical protein BBJ28_00018441 [Nothophytophthora sp. Chile5]
MNSGLWSEDEHDRFLMAIKEFPRGPWSSLAQSVGTRSVRQVQTHTQKYYEKIMRRLRGLRKNRKTWARVEHRIDDDILEFCECMKSSGSVTVVESASNSVETSSTIETSVASSSTASSSPSNSPLQYCSALALAGSELRHDEVCCSESDEEVETLYEPLSAGSVTWDLPPLEEALDFLIEFMRE